MNYDCKDKAFSIKSSIKPEEILLFAAFFSFLLTFLQEYARNNKKNRAKNKGIIVFFIAIFIAAILIFGAKLQKITRPTKKMHEKGTHFPYFY